MQTRTYYRRVALIGMLPVMTALLTLGSCDDDEKKKSTRDLLIGSWEPKEAEFDGVPADLDDFYMRVVFESDGDYTETSIEDSETAIYNGEWELSGNEIEIEYDDGGRWELDIESISETELRVEDDDLEALFERDN